MSYYWPQDSKTPQNCFFTMIGSRFGVVLVPQVTVRSQYWKTCKKKTQLFLGWGQEVLMNIKSRYHYAADLIQVSFTYLPSKKVFFFFTFCLIYWPFGSIPTTCSNRRQNRHAEGNETIYNLKVVKFKIFKVSENECIFKVVWNWDLSESHLWKLCVQI